MTADRPMKHRVTGLSGQLAHFGQMKAKIRLLLLLLSTAAACGVSASLAAAASIPAVAPQTNTGVDSTENYEHDHEEALKARVKGDVLPYAQILKLAQDQIHGDIVEIEFENDGGSWVYEIKYINSAARLVKLYIDAHSGKVLKVEGNSHASAASGAPLSAGD